MAVRGRMFNEKLEDALNVHDFDGCCAALPKWLFEFVDRGTEDESRCATNRAAFERIKLKDAGPGRRLAAQSGDHAFGKKHGMRWASAPTGPAECFGTRASSSSPAPPSREHSVHARDGFADEHGGRRETGRRHAVVQLYMWSDVRMSHVLVERAKNAGFEALV